MSRLSDREKEKEKPQDKVEETLINKKDEDVRINIVVKESDLKWLDQEIEKYNNTSPRNTNRSEVIRLLMRKIRDEGLEEIL